MLIIGRLRVHAVSLMGLSIHPLLAASTSEWSSSVATLTATIPELSIVCKILIIILTADVVKHRTITAIWMIVTYLVHVRIVLARIVVWMPIRVCMLTSSLALSLLLKHLVGLIRLWLTHKRGIRGRVATGLSFCGLPVTVLWLGVSSAGGILGALLWCRRAECASPSLLRRGRILRILLRGLAVISVIAILISISLIVRRVVRGHVVCSGRICALLSLGLGGWLGLCLGRRIAVVLRLLHLLTEWLIRLLCWRRKLLLTSLRTIAIVVWITRLRRLWRYACFAWQRLTGH